MTWKRLRAQELSPWEFHEHCPSQVKRYQHEVWSLDRQYTNRIQHLTIVLVVAEAAATANF
jgi:hypothetical protein